VVEKRIREILASKNVGFDPQKHDLPFVSKAVPKLYQEAVAQAMAEAAAQPAPQPAQAAAPQLGPPGIGPARGRGPRMAPRPGMDAVARGQQMPAGAPVSSIVV